MKKVGFAAIFATLMIGVASFAFSVTVNAATNSALGGAVNNAPVDVQSNAQLAKQVRHKLLMLPYYGVFDNLAYSIDGSKVTLHGQVVRPSTRTDAARSVAGIAGV